jgi:hypothetical protein
MVRALAAFAYVLTVGVAMGSPTLPQEAPARSLGVASCASSMCHGSVQPWHESGVRQDEYVTWSRTDRHARAYATLLTERSQKIAAKLGLARPAHEASECLDCHAHNVPAARRAPQFSISDGVACEACHGPAERWIRGHVERGATRARNEARGLYPTRDPVARGRLCLSCHYGDSQKLVTHRMMAAGHPRLSFEIDTFTHLMPAHYGAANFADGVRSWALGQALAAETLLTLLVHPRRGRDGFFPELVLFDCHACHHPMSQARNAGGRLGLAPGLVRLNDSHLIMVRHIAGRVDGEGSAALARAMADLHAALGGRGDALAQARRVLAAVQALVPRIHAHRFSADDLSAIAFGLIEDGVRGEYSDYQGAEQAAMALQSVADFMARRGFLKAAAIRAPMERMMAAVANDETYRAEEFAGALRELRAGIEKGMGE